MKRLILLALVVPGLALAEDPSSSPPPVVQPVAEPASAGAAAPPRWGIGGGLVFTDPASAVLLQLIAGGAYSLALPTPEASLEAPLSRSAYLTLGFSGGMVSPSVGNSTTTFASSLGLRYEATSPDAPVALSPLVAVDYRSVPNVSSYGAHLGLAVERLITDRVGLRFTTSLVRVLHTSLNQPNPPPYQLNNAATVYSVGFEPTLQLWIHF